MKWRMIPQTLSNLSCGISVKSRSNSFAHEKPNGCQTGFIHKHRISLISDWFVNNLTMVVCENIFLLFNQNLVSKVWLIQTNFVRKTILKTSQNRIFFRQSAHVYHTIRDLQSLGWSLSTEIHMKDFSDWQLMMIVRLCHCNHTAPKRLTNLSEISAKWRVDFCDLMKAWQLCNLLSHRTHPYQETNHTLREKKCSSNLSEVKNWFLWCRVWGLSQDADPAWDSGVKTGMISKRTVRDGGP